MYSRTLIFGFILEARMKREHLYTMKDMVVVVVTTVSPHRSLLFQKGLDHVEVACHMYMCKGPGRHWPIRVLYMLAKNA
jgi:hypothetical protein